MSQAAGQAHPILTTPSHLKVEPGGLFRSRLQAIVDGWLIPAPDANPGMLQNLRDRDRAPARDLMPWAGEFPGKYLTAASAVYRLRPDPHLRSRLETFVDQMLSTQAADGYLGPFPSDSRLIGPGLWDVWGHYHCILGLLHWEAISGDHRALAAAGRAADYLCAFFLDGRRRVIEAGSEEMNESIIHGLLLLSNRTANSRYRALATSVESDWQTPPSGDYVRSALAGEPFYRCPKPRWESLHCLQAIPELYYLTGDEKYRTALDTIWWSIVEGDRHNTGGFSSGEAACGSPYNRGAIETCCTVAWTALTVDFLKMTGLSLAADELELSLWNSGLGALHPSGRWSTYNTPMDGDRKASAHEIVFQARAGAPELNCCSVNAARLPGMAAEWALLQAWTDTLVLNWYGPCHLEASLPAIGRVRISQETSYPLSGLIKLDINPDRPSLFTLQLRIPGWSKQTAVRINDEEVSHAPAGEYLSIRREWRNNDQVLIDLDFQPWTWVGEESCARHVSIYRGPLLLAYDPRFDEHDPRALPSLDAGSLRVELEASRESVIGLFRLRDQSGAGYRVCDFASAGMAGNQYRSWLPAHGTSPIPFNRDNPLRLQRQA